MIASDTRFVVGITLALSLSLLGCSGSAPGGPRSVPDPTQIIGPSAVKHAPALKEGNDYQVLSSLPGKVGDRVTNWRGLVSESEAFGALTTPSADPESVPSSIVLMNTNTRRVKKVEELPAGTQLIGMDFSKDYIVWTETTSFSANSEPWSLRSYDRRTESVRTLATSNELGVGDPPWLAPVGVVPRLMNGQVYLLAADSARLPVTATAYRVPVDGSDGLAQVATDVQGAFTDSGDLLVIRDGEFFRRDTDDGSERRLDPKRRGSEKCPGWAREGVVVECDVRKGKPRLTILADGKTTEIRFPRPDPNSLNYGVGYLNASASWVAFSFNDKAHVLNLKTGKLGTLNGAQYTPSDPSWHQTIVYRKTGGVMPAPKTADAIRLR